MKSAFEKAAIITLVAAAVSFGLLSCAKGICPNPNRTMGFTEGRSHL